jgi:hypothetical protein
MVLSQFARALLVGLALFGAVTGGAVRASGNGSPGDASAGFGAAAVPDADRVPEVSSAPILSAAIPRPTPPSAITSITVPMLPASVAPPKIDGHIDDACWRRALHAVGFFRYSGSAPVTEQTEAWICCDRKRLYFAFHCIDSTPGHIRTSETQRDGTIWHDDFVGVDIDSQNTHRNLSSFCVSANGTQNGQIEGGTADNIAWTGDWHGASARTKDGWTCEIEIPFRLLRYTRGTHSFGMLLYRQLSRETNLTCWPYMPPGGDQEEGRYMTPFTGLQPPSLAARPVILPYFLTQQGASGGGAPPAHDQVGLDVKIPITTTMTGIATVNPDFLTVEQDVTNIAFSYTEKYLQDHRPFFADGSNFLPYQDIFYSNRIGQIDEGVKVVGKDGLTTVGLLALTRSDSDNFDLATDAGLGGQSAYVVDLRRDLGAFSSAAVNLVGDAEQGQPDNEVAKFEGVYGIHIGQRRRLTFQEDYIPSWDGGLDRGAKEYAAVDSNPEPGRPNVHVEYDSAAPDFTANLGYDPDLDYRGEQIAAEQDNHFDRGGPIESYETDAVLESYQHFTGGFYRRTLAEHADITMRSGWSYDVTHSEAGHDQYRDHTNDANVAWNNKRLFQRGNVEVTTGTVAGAPYRYVDVHQGILLARPLSLATEVSTSRDGTLNEDQEIVTGTYRLDTTRTIAGRLVRQAGHDPTLAPGTEPPQGANLYLSFSQRARNGNDYFLLIGDPNAIATRGLVTLKVIRPL